MAEQQELYPHLIHMRPIVSGRTERDKALTQVEQAADARWMTEAYMALNDLILRGTPFTSDDLWERLESPREPRAMGAVIVSAVRERRIRKIGWRQSTRAVCHARPLAVWAPVIEQEQCEQNSPLQIR